MYGDSDTNYTNLYIFSILRQKTGTDNLNAKQNIVETL